MILNFLFYIKKLYDYLLNDLRNIYKLNFKGKIFSRTRLLSRSIILFYFLSEKAESNSKHIESLGTGFSLSFNCQRLPYLGNTLWIHTQKRGKPIS